LIELGTGRCTLARICTYARRAAELEYRFLCANDHLMFRRPWIDGPTALAAVLEASGDMTLATTVSLPVIRGPVQAAKTLAALDILSGGRLVVGVGPGSSARDFAASGIAFEERWTRFDEAIRALRALLSSDSAEFVGAFYSTEGIALEPRPRRQGCPPIWIASWGSQAGLRRTARLGDGWLASGYNTTPARFGAGLAVLAEQLRAAGRSPEELPNGIATMWLYIAERRRESERILTEVLAPMLDRSPDELRRLALPIGSAEECAERISAFARSGAQRVFVWPLADELRQLELFRERVWPVVA
jgi:alkanesulfonate monooxygenase SsuD/methylene tetrahydromethanopterin reductase-like flavin-dependent oxidoreductase (luciferase family)